MSKAKQGDTVKVHYTGKLEDGTVFDSTEDRDPIKFTVGQGQVIPGFEQAVIGMNQGETKTETVPADQAYGPYKKDMLIEVDKNKLPQNLNPEVGQELQVRQQNGQQIPVMVKEVSDSSVTLDANHPLAGRDLTFDIQLVEIEQ